MSYSAGPQEQDDRNTGDPDLGSNSPPVHSGDAAGVDNDGAAAAATGYGVAVTESTVLHHAGQMGDSVMCIFSSSSSSLFTFLVVGGGGGLKNVL